jgi:transposase
MPRPASPPNDCHSQLAAHVHHKIAADITMPLSEAELVLVEAMFMNNCNVKTVLSVMPHAIQSTLYRQKKNFETYGSIHDPAKRRRRRKQSGAEAEPEAPAATREITEVDRTIEMLFSQGCNVRVVQSWVPNIPRSNLYRMQQNFKTFGSLHKPETLWKKKGRRSIVTSDMKSYVARLVEDGKDMWQRDLARELSTKFGVSVSASTVSRLLKDYHLSKKAGPVTSTEAQVATGAEALRATTATEDLNLDPTLRY